MRSVLLWLLRIVVFVLLVGFVAKNFDSVTLRYYLDYQYQLPLSVLLLIAFTLGMVIGYLSHLRGNKPPKKEA